MVMNWLNFLLVEDHSSFDGLISKCHIFVTSSSRI